MRKRVILAAVLAAALLTSCASTPPKTVYIPKTKVLAIPAEFKLTDPIPAPPFTPEEYGAMSVERREEMAFGYIDTLRLFAGNANIKTRKLADWERKQRILYQSEFDEPPIGGSIYSLSIR